MKKYLPFLLLLSGAMLSECSSGGGSSIPEKLREDTFSGRGYLQDFSRPGSFAHFRVQARDGQTLIARGRSMDARVPGTGVASIGERACEISFNGPWVEIEIPLRLDAGMNDVVVDAGPDGNGHFALDYIEVR